MQCTNICTHVTHMYTHSTIRADLRITTVNVYRGPVDLHFDRDVYYSAPLSGARRGLDAGV